MSRTVVDVLREAGSTTSEAVVDGDRRLDYPEFVAAVRLAAAAFVGSGLRPGDRIAIWAPNRLEWMLAALGAQYVGAALVPLNTRFRGQEAAEILRRTGATFLVVDQGFLGTDHLGLLRGATEDDTAGPADPSGPVPELPGLHTVVTVGAPAEGTIGWDRFLAAADQVRPGQVEELADAVGPGAIADILFTSGTTGRPKGAMASHAQAVGTAETWAGLAGVTAADRYLIINPFFHSFGYKAGYLACLLRGATIVPQPVFDVARTLDLIERERITLLPGPPAIYQTLLDAPELAGRDISSLRLAVTGAATIPTVLIERASDELGFDTVLTAYGLTEVPVVTMCTPSDDAKTVATTCGPAVEGIEVRTIDAAGAPTAAGVPGEVLVRGANVMLGYLDDPAATREAVDPDGWLHTGDVGVLDAGGYLTLTDRIKDMFTVGGFNVYPAEVEQVITGHPAVLECAVVGVPDHRLGEVGRVHVKLRRGATLSAGDLLAHCGARLANYKVPRTVVFTDELPRNAGGKVLKTQLREQANP